MNVSKKERPTNHGQSGKQLVPQTTSQLLLDEPELDFELCEKFTAWLEPRLDSLLDQHATFITADSLRRDLKRR